ncbi:MAG: hypothetical protein KGI33_07730 [Thaumarchaeota archaeon]|nr:hypothetical protein [Nitrososphaerota archaeon]
MKKVWFLLIALSFFAGATIESSTHAAAQQTSIPSWVKNTALWWGKGQIADADFIKAIQWLVDNGLIHVSNSQTLPQTTGSLPAVNSTIFSPCTEVNLGSASDCLAKYLPLPSEIGPQWSSHNGIDIPNGIQSKVMTQMVREDFENVNSNPVEIFDVWIQEYQPPEKGQAIFKMDENSMQKGATKFFGDANSNDTSFICICGDGTGGTSYNSEFVAGSVIVKVDGIGNPKTVISDMGNINKIILSKIIQSQ